MHLTFENQSLTTLKKFNIDQAKVGGWEGGGGGGGVVSVCLSECLSVTNDSSETFNVIIIKLGTVTASDMRVHQVLSLLTLTFIQMLL